MKLRWFTGTLLSLLLLAGADACSDGDGNDRPASSDRNVTEVVRHVLGQSAADTAPGQTVELTRVIVPAGQSLARHTHPGPQMAVIVEGTLTYSVVEGRVQVSRAAGTQQAKTETVAGGQTVELRPGDAVVETPGMVHAARNAGDVPVVIYTSSLFPTGAPPSSPAP